jgi:hypothetical protein
MVLPTIVDFCLNIITNPDQAVPVFEELLIECMVLVKSVLECKEYRQTLTGRVVDQNGGTLTLEDQKKTISAAVNDMMKTVLPNDRVVLLCNILIRRYSGVVKFIFLMS